MTLSLAGPPPPPPSIAAQRRADTAVANAALATATLSDVEAVDPRVIAAVAELDAAARRIASARLSARVEPLATVAQP